jgi:4-hydroxyphenylpyruvate dioxygenase
MSDAPGPRRSIATVCLSGGLGEKLAAATRVGFDAVEIFENDLLTFDGSPADVRRMCEDLGLAIVLFQPFRDFEAMPDASRSRNLDRAERKFDVMQQLGTDLVLVCSNTLPASLDDDARAAADLRAMAERAAIRGLRVGYEALAWGRNVNTWGHAWKIVQQADHPALGLIVDSFHTLAIGDDPAGIADVPAEKLFFVQLADAPLLSMDVLSWSRHHRNFPGQGALDVAGFVRAVHASGYRGPLSLEIFNDEFRSAPALPTAFDGLRSLALIEAEAGITTLPPPPRVHGFEFLEFAVDEAASTALEAFLSGLGFHLAGTHKSKDVLLYRRGDVNFVLNREQDSAAFEHFLLHGPSVCAMGLRTEDVDAAMRRADALLCPPWNGAIGPGERRIPAVRAPDGMLIHLIQRSPTGRTNWDDDFDLLPAPAAHGTTRIDHVAEAFPAGRMDSAVLFWRAVFGFTAAPVVEIPDPFGLVRSRAMISPDGSVRLPLNISESRQTATGRFVSAFGGAGVQHVALAVDDVSGAIDALAAREAGLLRIPPNYYEDVAARWGLEDDALKALEDRHLLYDRDAGGEFIHAYTAPFQDRFFFEIVERRGSQGFGAANAGVRMAAQAQRRENTGTPLPIG